MENKEVKIIPPEGYCIDEANSTLNCIKFRPKSLSLTYVDIERELFKNGYYYSQLGIIKHNSEQVAGIHSPIDATSRKQLQKLFAINKLMNVAKYLNGDWKPNWEDTTESKWCIEVNKSNEIWINFYISYFNMGIYFKTKELANKAIRILGADTVRLALSTNW